MDGFKLKSVMTTIRNIILIIAFLLVYQLSWTQSSSKDKINLQKIIFHSSRCNGSCPQIDFQVDGKKDIIVNREYFKNKSENDESKSGHFKGVLDTDTYSQLLEILAKSNFKNLKFPDVDCCDGIITTIIIYSDNKRTYLKSMTPPEEASELISFLYKIGTTANLEKTNEEIALEE